MVYLAGFENRASRKAHTGSNPVSSAFVMKFEFSAGGTDKRSEEAFLRAKRDKGGTI